MTAAELLSLEVVDESGRRLGKVHDLRLRRSSRDAWTIDALVVGASALSYRLGYANHEVRGPSALETVVRWLTRGVMEIAWSDVVSVEDERVTVRPRRSHD